MEGIYRVKVYCSNCDFIGPIDIPKGQMIDETPCENCGNITLNKEVDVVLGENYYE